MISLFIENFKISLSAVFANKMRSILTALGIVIGVLSVTLMGTLISGLDRSFEVSMSWLGKDILYISRYEWFSDMDWWEVKNRPQMRPEYVNKIMQRSKYALAVAPVMQRGASLSYKDKEIQTEIFGTNEEYMETISTDIAKGRFFTRNEDRVGSRVTVIGDGIKEAFFGDQEAIGRYIKIDNMKFRVIGVLEKQGKFLGLFSVDKQAILPFGAYKRIFSKRGWMRLSVKVPENKLDESIDEISAVMRHIRGLKPSQENDFAINQTKIFEKQYNASGFCGRNFSACRWNRNHEYNVCFCKRTNQRDWRAKSYWCNQKNDYGAIFNGSSNYMLNCWINWTGFCIHN